MSNPTDQPTTSDPEPTSVRLLGPTLAETAATLDSRGFAVVADAVDDHAATDADTVADTDSVVDTDVVSDAPVDCVVVDAAVARTVDDTSPWPDSPVLLYAADTRVVDDRSRFDGYARPGDVDALCDQIRWVTGAVHPPNPTTDDDRLEALHHGTVSLIDAATEDELFDRTVDIASRLLEFDSCYIAVAEDGQLVKRAGAGDVTEESIPVDHGIVGRTYQTDTTYLVNDTQTEPGAEPVRPSHRSGISVPLGDEGVFVVIADEPNAFTDRDRDLAELLVRYAEGTLARIRSAAAIQERRDLVESLHEGSAALAAVKSVESAAAVAVELAERILSFDICYVGVREGDTVVPYAVSSGAPPDAARPMHVSEGLVGKTLRTGESQLVDRVDDSDAEPVRDEYRSGLSIPLGDDGVFQAVSREEHAFDDDDLDLAELLAAHVTETFSRLHAEADLGDQRERIARLHARTATLVGCDDVAELYEQCVETARSVLDFETAYLFVVEDDQFVPAAQAVHPDHDRIDPIPLDYGVAAETYRTGTARLVRDFESDETAKPLQATSGGGISVPLGDDGVFQAVSRAPEQFGSVDLELAELLVSHVTATRERLRAEAELRGQRDRLSALFENVPDAAVSYELIDGDPHVIAVNPAFERIFGFTNEELVGENIDEYILPPDEAEATTAAALNEQLERGESVRTECRRQTRDGIRTFLLQVVPIELGRTNVSGFAIYTDITARREHEHELRRQNERLEEFANIVSHDLRNPLAIATGYLDLAAERGDLEAFERVAEALDRMDQLIEDLLSLARTGQVVGETTALDVTAVATQAWAGVDTADATLELPESLPAEADERRLIELFENLFRNAVEHAGPDVTVRIEALDTGEPATGSAGFAVEDDGPGIPPERRETVVEPGETTSDGGIGYGLSIVARIAEAHGWSLSITDGTTGGVRFEFTGVDGA